MHFTKFAFLALGILMMANASPASAKKADDEKLASDVRDAMTRFEEKDSTFKKTTESVVGYAIFPEVAKGGFIVGGSSGRGEVYEGGKLIGYGKLSKERSARRSAARSLHKSSCSRPRALSIVSRKTVSSSAHRPRRMLPIKVARPRPSTPMAWRSSSFQLLD